MTYQEQSAGVPVFTDKLLLQGIQAQKLYICGEIFLDRLSCKEIHVRE